jgi:hypothetical protein
MERGGEVSAARLADLKDMQRALARCEPMPPHEFSRRAATTAANFEIKAKAVADSACRGHRQPAHVDRSQQGQG